MTMIRNERTKLTATFLNGLAIATFARKQPPKGQRVAGLRTGAECDGLPGQPCVEGLLAEGGVITLAGLGEQTNGQI